MTLPAFTATHTLPPFVGVWPDGGPASLAPFAVTMDELCTVLSFTAERRTILIGLLSLRERLRSLGIQIVTQWLDGSFVEHIEASEGRSPGDIDVMTFLNRPASAQSDPDFAHLVNSNLELFQRDNCKKVFKCDHFQTDLTYPPSVDGICYWHSVFAHRRDGAWKGYLKVGDEGSATDARLLAALRAT